MCESNVLVFLIVDNLRFMLKLLESLEDIRSKSNFIFQHSRIYDPDEYVIKLQTKIMVRLRIAIRFPIVNMFPKAYIYIMKF